MSDGAVHLQAYPGATTCVVIGPLTVEALRRLPACRVLLWFAPDETSPAPTLPFGTDLQRVSLAEPATLASELERFLRLDARHLPSVLLSHSPDPRLDPALATVSALLEKHHRARVTRQRDGFRWQKHVLGNLPGYLRHPLRADWAGALSGRPAAICGAGPSLDVSAPQLAACADRIVIFAADSALHTLARHGITADFVVSVDVAKEPGKCLPPDRVPRHTVLSPVSPPAWHNAVPAGSACFVSGNQITTDWLQSPQTPRPPLAVAENCGVTALVLARWLGCAPLHLFGLDLALAPGAQRHTTGADASLYAQSGFVAAQQHPAVPGNYTATVPTHVISDWRALDQRLAGWPAGLVINVNDRGARLRHTTLVHPGQFKWEGTGTKSAWLAALDAPEPQPAAQAATAALARLQAAGRKCATNLPALRKALRSGGPDALVPHLRQLLRDDSTSRMLGAYALKLMPHLLPPTEGDEAFWTSQLDELAELTGLASGG